MDDEEAHYIVVAYSHRPISRTDVRSTLLVLLIFVLTPSSDQVEKLLGQGTFGKVVQAREKTRQNQLVAINIIRSVQKYSDASRIDRKSVV